MWSLGLVDSPPRHPQSHWVAKFHTPMCWIARALEKLHYEIASPRPQRQALHRQIYFLLVLLSCHYPYWPFIALSFITNGLVFTPYGQSPLGMLLVLVWGLVFGLWSPQFGIDTHVCFAGVAKDECHGLLRMNVVSLWVVKDERHKLVSWRGWVQWQSSR